MFKQKNIAIHLHQSPYGSLIAEEQLHIALIASSYANVSLFFSGNALWQLIPSQCPHQQKSFTNVFGALDLYGIHHIYVCETSLQERGLSSCDLIIEATHINFVSPQAIQALLASSDIVIS